MQAQKVAAFGSAGVDMQPPHHAKAENLGGADLRPGHPAPTKEPIDQDFALAMRRVEAECYDTL